MSFNISKPVENKNDNIAWWGLELCRCHAYVIYNIKNSNNPKEVRKGKIEK